jgi:hypothetical protein
VLAPTKTGGPHSKIFRTSLKCEEKRNLQTKN